MCHSVVIREKPPSKRCRIRSSGLSFLMHGFITLSDATSYDKNCLFNIFKRCRFHLRLHFTAFNDPRGKIMPPVANPGVGGGCCGCFSTPPEPSKIKPTSPITFWVKDTFSHSLGLTKLPRELEVALGDASVYSTILLSVWHLLQCA